MAAINADVMEMVRNEIQQNPNPEWKDLDLKRKAEDLDASIKDLTPQQFNARYTLQVIRVLKQGNGKVGSPSPRKRGTKAPASDPTPDRPRARSSRRSAAPDPMPTNPKDEVRQVLLTFAGVLGEADDKKSFVKALTGMETYVEMIHGAYTATQ